MAAITYIFGGTIIVGIIASAFAFYSLKYNLSETFSSVKFRAIAVLLFAVSFIIHTAGDYFSGTYGESIEHNLESIAHIIIFIGFIFLLYSTKHLLKTSEEHGLR